ncbi:MAG: hypothetical protein HQ483_11935 [Rhodospirillales bacterium]|nr:hypothetical protein [Rhodospirillales bacterium]
MNAIQRRPLAAVRTPFYRLAPSQRQLVSAMRRWTEGTAGRPDVIESLFSLFGIYYIEATLEAFDTVMFALADNPANPVGLYPAGCSRVSAGELATLKLITAFQANDLGITQSLARELAGPEGAPELLAACSVIAEALDARRILFTLREYKPLALMVVAGQG